MVRSNGAIVSNGISLDLAAAPAWSPDGNQIAFFAQPGTGALNLDIDREGIWTISYPPDEPKLLFPTDHVKNLAWSPNEEYLAFEVEPSGQRAGVVIIRATDGGVVSRFDGQQPAWFPGEDKLVIKAEPRGECGLWQVDLDDDPSEPRTRITSDCTDTYPVLSPNGQYLAFSSRRAGNEDIYLMKLSNGELQRVTKRPCEDTTPIFGPDGQRLFYRSNSFRPDWQVVVVDLDERIPVAVRNGVGPAQ